MARGDSPWEHVTALDIGGVRYEATTLSNGSPADIGGKRGKWALEDFVGILLARVEMVRREQLEGFGASLWRDPRAPDRALLIWPDHGFWVCRTFRPSAVG